MTQENRYEPPKAAVADAVDTSTEELATRWERLGAALIDGLLSLIIVFPLMFATGIWQQLMAAGGEMQFELQVQLILFGIVLFLLLHGYLLHKYGQTIGKRAVGTRIVSVEDNSILPLWKVLVLRFLPISLGSQIPYVGGFVGIIDSLFVFRGDKRCIHDLIAGTKVIKASSPWTNGA